MGLVYLLNSSVESVESNSHVGFPTYVTQMNLIISSKYYKSISPLEKSM